MLMTTKGQSVRIRVCDIRETGRNAQGVKLMGLRDGETIQDVATVVADDAEPVIESAGGTEPEAEATVLTETATEAAPEAPAAS
jgi:DNA gyrase subunit A